MKDIFIAIIVGIAILMFIFIMELSMICSDLKEQVDYYKEMYQDQSIVVRVLQESCCVE